MAYQSIFFSQKRITKGIVLVCLGMLTFGSLIFPSFKPAQAIIISPLIFEFEGRPGDKMIGLMKVTNESDIERSYYPVVENFIAGGEGGEPTFVPKSAEEYGLANWVTVPDKKLTLAPKEKRSVIFEIDIPKNADPGGHYAAVFWSTQPPSPAGTAVGAVAMAGSLVLLRIAGEAKEDVRVSDFRTSDNKYFFTHLPVNILTRLENKGNVHLKPRGAIVIKNMIGRQSAVLTFNPSGGNVLPASARRFENTWRKNPDTSGSEWQQEWKNFGLGRYTAVLSVPYGLGNEKMLTGTFHFWVISWQVTLVFLILTVLALLMLWFLIKQYNQWIIRRARRR